MRSWSFWIVLAGILATVNGLIAHKEATLRSGRRMLLRLAPVDQRSLMQGDCMVLSYELERSVPTAALPRDGRVVVAVDHNDVAEFVRVHAGEPLAPGEQLLRYRIRGRIRLGAESFFFQEGHDKLYRGARYGELRVAANGSSVLVGLCNEERRPLGSPVR